MKAYGEAPGKAIFTGEHFVVHGAYAIAAAIDKRVRVETSKSDELVIESDRFRGVYTTSSRQIQLHPIAKMLGKILREVGGKANLRIRITSEIPYGVGLGSSASMLVATVASASVLLDWDLNTRDIVRYAMIGEREIHGRPSGIDPSISALGGLILFRMGEEPRRIQLPKPLRIIIASSGKRRRTKELIDRVSLMRKRYPNLFAKLTEAATQISRLSAERLAREELGDFGGLLCYNHEVLEKVGASNVALDELVELCIGLGCYGAKLTGAGGGGSVLAIPRQNRVQDILRHLNEKGYGSFVSTIPCGGVKSWVVQ